MKAEFLPFLWIDLVKRAPDCETPGFGIYVLGPTNYDPDSIKAEEFLKLLCWNGRTILVKVKAPSVVDPFGPIFTPSLLARVWQSPKQDTCALEVDPSMADALSSSKPCYLAGGPIRVVSSVACVEWSEDAFVRPEIPKSAYEDHPSYRATAERLRSKGFDEGPVKADLRRDAIGIPISFRLGSPERLADGIMILQSQQPTVATIKLMEPANSDSLPIEPGLLIEYRGKFVGSIISVEKTRD